MPYPSPQPSHERPTPSEQRVLDALSCPGARLVPWPAHEWTIMTGLYRLSWQPRDATVHLLLRSGWIVERSDAYSRKFYVLTLSGAGLVSPCR